MESASRTFLIHLNTLCVKNTTHQILPMWMEHTEGFMNSSIFVNGYLDLLEREEKNETVQRYVSQIQNRTEVVKLFSYFIFVDSDRCNPSARTF